MYARYQFEFFEALFEGIGKLHRFIGPLLLYLLISAGRTFLLGSTNAFFNVMIVIVLGVFFILASVTIYLRLRDIHEGKKRNVFALLAESKAYFWSLIGASFTIAFIYLLVGLVFWFFKILMPFRLIMVLLFSFISFSGMFAFIFVQQGIILGDLGIGDSIVLSIDIFKMNFWKCLGISILAFFCGLLGNTILTALPGGLGSQIFVMLADAVITTLSIIVLSIMFYQATEGSLLERHPTAESYDVFSATNDK